MYELFSAFFPILRSFSLKPLTRNHSYVIVYYVFLIIVLRPQCHLALLFLKPMHRIALNFLWMFLGLKPYQVCSKWDASHISLCIMGIFVNFLADSYKFFDKTTDQKSFIFGWKRT